MDQPCLAPDVRIGGQGDDRAADQGRGLGLGEIGILGDGGAPVVLAHAEVLQHRLRAQETGRDGQRGDVRADQLHGHAVGQARQGRLDQVVEDVAAVAGEMAVDHLDDQAPVLLDHERRQQPVGDQVADQGLVEIGAHAGKVDLPELSGPVDHGIAAPDAVDQHVQASGFAADALGQRRDLVLAGVIDPHRERPAAGRLDQGDGLVDGLGAIHAPRMADRAAPRAIDQGPGLAERARDAPASAPRRTRDQGHLSVQKPTLSSHAHAPAAVYK